MASAQALRRSAWALEPDGVPQLRITFGVDEKDNEIVNLDFEDYH
jgi:hypothetical protein